MLSTQMDITTNSSGLFTLCNQPWLVMRAVFCSIPIVNLTNMLPLPKWWCRLQEVFSICVLLWGSIYTCICQCKPNWIQAWQYLIPMGMVVPVAGDGIAVVMATVAVPWDWAAVARPTPAGRLFVRVAMVMGSVGAVVTVRCDITNLGGLKLSPGKQNTHNVKAAT